MDFSEVLLDLVHPLQQVRIPRVRVQHVIFNRLQSLVESLKHIVPVISDLVEQFVEQIFCSEGAAILRAIGSESALEFIDCRHC